MISKPNEPKMWGEMPLVYHRHMNVAFMAYSYRLRNKWVYKYEQSQNMNECKILIKSMT